MAWMLAWLVIGLLSFGVCLHPERDEIEVDLLEVHTLHDKACRPIFSQVIAWNRFWEDNDRLHNVGWRIVGERWWERPTRVEDRYVVLVFEKRKAIVVQSRAIRYSWSQHDPEREDTRVFWRNQCITNVFEEMKRVD